MGDIEHLSLGVNSSSRLELSGANLGQLNLSGANLDRADLSKANLTDANLSQTSLRGANLEWAILRRTDLRGAKLDDAILRYADLKEAIVKDVDLSGVDMSHADLRGVDFHGKSLRRTNFNKAKLQGANLSGAYLKGADLSQAKLQGANLSGADLSWANLSGADLTGADLTGCRIYGIAAWDVILEKTTQVGLMITEEPEKDSRKPQPLITVDNLEVAQFINVLRDNKNIGKVIDEITSKVVLILGRFTDDRKPVLDALRDELPKHNLSPVIFDFDPSNERDLTETITLLTSISHSVIVDLTDAKSVPQELYAIVPHFPSVPVLPIIHGKTTKEYSMFERFRRYSWVLQIYHYEDIPGLIDATEEHIIKPLKQKKDEIKNTKVEEEKRELEEEKRELEEKKRELEEKERSLKEKERGLKEKVRKLE